MNKRNMKQLFLFFLLPSIITVVHAGAPTERSIQIMNQSGRRVDIHWINPDPGEMVLQSSPDLLNGASQDLNSYVTHHFQVRELPAKKTGVCAGQDEACRVDHFTVNENQNQVVFINEGIELKHSDSKTIADEAAAKLLDECKSTAKRQLSKNTSNDADARAIILEELANCVQDGITKEIERANEEVAFQTQIRTKMADSWDNYTCADKLGMNATEPQKNSVWKGKKEAILLDRPTSKIRTIQHFLNEEECQAVERASEGSWSSSQDGPWIAKEARIKVNWKREKGGDSIAKLSRRVYEYVNHVLPTLDISENGQEDLLSTHYSGGIGKEDRTPDRYLPNCNGDCAGLTFQTGNRVATIVMYCDVPTLGGEANFRNAGVHIHPKQYSAIFFSYIDPGTMRMDSGFTEHSGCPVLEGEKKIVTQRVRLGVDNENPWSLVYSKMK